MKTASLTLLPLTAHGTETGNYDGISEEFNGIAVKAAAYYAKNKTVQTVSWYVSEFTGTIIIEGTLDVDPATATFFQISESITNIPEPTVPPEPPAPEPIPMTVNNARNIEGNFTWIRVRITDFTAGSISKIVVSY